MRFDNSRTLALCLPSATYGPVCSVPPMGMRIVVVPAATLDCTSVLVKFSKKTASSWLILPFIGASFAQALDGDNPSTKILKQNAIKQCFACKADFKHEE